MLTKKSYLRWYVSTISSFCILSPSSQQNLTFRIFHHLHPVTCVILFLAEQSLANIRKLSHWLRVCPQDQKNIGISSSRYIQESDNHGHGVGRVRTRNLTTGSNVVIDQESFYDEELSELWDKRFLFEFLRSTPLATEGGEKSSIGSNREKWKDFVILVYATGSR